MGIQSRLDRVSEFPFRSKRPEDIISFLEPGSPLFDEGMAALPLGEGAEQLPLPIRDFGSGDEDPAATEINEHLLISKGIRGSGNKISHIVRGQIRPQQKISVVQHGVVLLMNVFSRSIVL